MASDIQAVTITIDGPAGAGKSTVAQLLAEKLGYSYLDTGAMYRALTLKALKTGTDLNNEDQLAEMASRTAVEVYSGKGTTRVELDGEDVSDAIRSIEVTNNTSHIASKAKVREVAVGWQRAFGLSRSIVVEGRDIGSVVFPDAQIKIYLDAKPEERARRRADELKAKGLEVDEAKLAKEISERDRMDMTRKVSPLTKPADAIEFDSSGMQAEEVVAELVNIIKDRI